MIFDGTTSSTAVSIASENATDIISYTICNKSGGAVTASVGIFYGSTITYILYQEPLAAAGSVTCNYVYLGEKIRVSPNYQILITVTGSCDYYFTIT